VVVVVVLPLESVEVLLELVYVNAEEHVLGPTMVHLTSTLGIDVNEGAVVVEVQVLSKRAAKARQSLYELV
jgi:hypothetical protein